MHILNRPTEMVLIISTLQNNFTHKHTQIHTHSHRNYGSKKIIITAKIITIVSFITPAIKGNKLMIYGHHQFQFMQRSYKVLLSIVLLKVLPSIVDQLWSLSTPASPNNCITLYTNYTQLCVINCMHRLRKNLPKLTFQNQTTCLLLRV